VDLLFAIFQAVGIALAAGALIGAAGREEMARALAIVAAVAGAALGAFSVAADGESFPIGLAVGVLMAPLALAVVTSIVAGAARRSGESGGVIGAVVALAALASAGLSILLPPIGAVIAVGIAFLAFARRRRADRKHGGLRILR